MGALNVPALLETQRAFFGSGRTRDLEFRSRQLVRLKSAIKAMEPEILSALSADLGKSAFEGYASEIGFVYDEINHALKHLGVWARPRKVPTPFLYQPGKSFIYPQPKGVVLIIGPWNYPFMLLLAPLVASVAAGNCAIVKPSEISTHTASVVTRLLGSAFASEFCAVVNGGAEESAALLRERFDHVFFTGSSSVGRVVLRAAAEHLTPVTLELGGKSPCIVDSDVDLRIAARRIVWGKFYNAGQTCVAPDYLLVHRTVKAELLAAMQEDLHSFFGADPQLSADYGRIISERHFDRLESLIVGQEKKLVAGGARARETRYFAPAILDGVTLQDKVMEEEIFGPILPVLAYDELGDAFAIVGGRPKPLACYVFSRRDAIAKRVIEELSFGGGCVNNTLVHAASPHLPFGGVGSSGMGAYHGKFGFDAFSHHKGITESPASFDVPLKYPPYTAGRLSWLRRILS